MLRKSVISSSSSSEARNLIKFYRTVVIVNLALPREKRNQEKTSVNTFNNNQPFPIKKTVQVKE
jgi:hypothetical protein